MGLTTMVEPDQMLDLVRGYRLKVKVEGGLGGVCLKTVVGIELDIGINNTRWQYLRQRMTCRLRHRLAMPSR
jgi:hypothetical protein